MKPFYPALIVAILLSAACSKKDEFAPVNTTTADSTSVFKKFPALSEHNKEVSWIVHYQGDITADTIDPRKSFFDTGIHFYSTITATDRDTMFKNYGTKKYRIYRSSNHVVNTRLKRDGPDYNTYLYVHYDSINNLLESYDPYYPNAQKR